MFETTIRGHFDAAHFLREYPGKCERCHGHRFEVTVTVAMSELDRMGLTIDFHTLKGHLRKVTDLLDHVSLNDLPPFDKINPSSENLALFIFQELKPLLAEGTLKQVTVWESPDAWTTFKEG